MAHQALPSSQHRLLLSDTTSATCARQCLDGEWHTSSAMSARQCLDGEWHQLCLVSQCLDGEWHTSTATCVSACHCLDGEWHTSYATCVVAWTMSKIPAHIHLRRSDSLVSFLWMFSLLLFLKNCWMCLYLWCGSGNGMDFTFCYSRNNNSFSRLQVSVRVIL